MASASLCRCGLPRSLQAMLVLFTCDVCGEQTTSNGPYIPAAGALELGHRWRLDLCRACLEALIIRAPEDVRTMLRRQAFGESGAL